MQQIWPLFKNNVSVRSSRWSSWLVFCQIRKISSKFELNSPSQLSRMHRLVRKITTILCTRALSPSPLSCKNRKICFISRRRSARPPIFGAVGFKTTFKLKFAVSLDTHIICKLYNKQMEYWKRKLNLVKIFYCKTAEMVSLNWYLQCGMVYQFYFPHHLLQIKVEQEKANNRIEWYIWFTRHFNYE